MYKISFFCKGKPQGKERPRTVRKNGKVWSYTPKRSKEYESKVRSSFLDNPDFFDCPFDTSKYEGKVFVYIIAYFKMPNSWSESKRFLNNNQSVLKKPDADNIGKSILDSLNNIAYVDDSQVANLTVSKRYGVEEGVKVELTYYYEQK